MIQRIKKPHGYHGLGALVPEACSCTASCGAAVQTPGYQLTLKNKKKNHKENWWTFFIKRFPLHFNLASNQIWNQHYFLFFAWSLCLESVLEVWYLTAGRAPVGPGKRWISWRRRGKRNCWEVTIAGKTGKTWNRVPCDILWPCAPTCSHALFPFDRSYGRWPGKNFLPEAEPGK